MPNDPQLNALKVPPHSIEAEQSVLGGLLLDNTAIDRIADLITPTDFYNDAHRLMFEHIIKLGMHGKPADALTLAEALGSVQKLDYVGGLPYIGALAQNVPSAANIRAYAQIVRERSVLRKLAAVGTDITDSAFSPMGRSASQLLDEAEAKVFDIAEQGARGQTGFQELRPLLTKVVERIEELYNRDSASDVTGIATGYNDLDSKTSGLQPGDLVIVAGRPSMGKAQPLDAQVKTLDGWKAMGDVRVGDALASIDGAPSFVSGVFPQGVRQVYRVTFSDGRSCECCAEHLWRVHHRDWLEPRVLSTAKVIAMLERSRYRGRLWIDMPSGDFGDPEALPVDPWVLGALIGDGSFTQSSIRFSAAVDALRDCLAERIDAELELELELSDARGVDYRIVRRDCGRRKGVAGVAANALTEAIASLGLMGLHSHQKFIPDRYLRASRAQRLDLLRGLLDTDGSVTKWGSIRYVTTSERLVRDVVELVRSLGGWCSVRSKQTSDTYLGVKALGRPSYVCTIHHPEPTSLLLLSDKQARALAAPIRCRRPTFASIEPTRLVATQCIAVTHPAHLYITDDYVVTHNTALALNIAENVALNVGLPVAVFSMEMGATQLAMRLIGSVGKLDQHKIRTGKLHNDDWERLSSALGRLNEAPMHIDETPALNPLELRARARRLHRQTGGLGLIVVDYLQLMQAASQGENRATEISEVSRSLKALAKELAVPVVALSQLNRGLEQRPNKRPIMSDLRECVTGDTRVCTIDGDRVPIRELVGSSPDVWSIDAHGDVVRGHSDCVWSKGVKPVVGITLAGGRRLRVTPQHRLLGVNGWQRVVRLGVGDVLATSDDRPGLSRSTQRSGIVWEPIVSMRPEGEEEVFDLTVPGPSSWLADGIVSHNSGAIEQDADLILFIYRDEVYNPDSTDKGTAEIIIAKQRNGPIGMVRLTFLGEYTRFENFATAY